MIATLMSPVTEAHKAITSPYNYNDHVYPILRERCSRCHFDGGPTPMSLMSYKDAIPWAESIREQLVGEKMPPWYPDMMGPAVKAGHPLPTRELDVLVTWAVGGTPQGDFAKDPPPFAPPVNVWRTGEPDVKIPMAAEHTLPAGTMEETKEFLLSTGFTEVKWVKAADLMPGRASMVRDAVVSVENGPVLAAWVPGHEATAAPSGAAFKVPAGAKIKLQVHYKKHWQDEQETRSDKSIVGLYLTDAPVSGRELQALAIRWSDLRRGAGEAHLLGRAQDRGTGGRHPPELRSGVSDRRRARRAAGRTESPPAAAPFGAAAVVPAVLARGAHRAAGRRQGRDRRHAGAPRRVRDPDSAAIPAASQFGLRSSVSGPEGSRARRPCRRRGESLLATCRGNAAGPVIVPDQPRFSGATHRFPD